MDQQVTRLGNGITVASVNLPGFRSVAVGAFIRVGSRNDPKNRHGVAHLLEHMAFKGTETRSAYQIVEEIERAGCAINAFTQISRTGYTASGLAGHLPLMVEILGDVVCRSTFPEVEFGAERDVVLHELVEEHERPRAMLRQEWNDIAYDVHPASRPIIGKEPYLRTEACGDHLREFVVAHYTGKNTVIVAAGAVEHAHFVALVEGEFMQMPGGMGDDQASWDTPVYLGGSGSRTGSTDRTHLMLGFPIPPEFSPRHVAYDLLSVAIGDGMSSPMFQEIREKRGLAYRVGSATFVEPDFASLRLTATVDDGRAKAAVDLMADILLRYANRCDLRSLERAKNMRRTSFIRSFESPDSVIEDVADDLHQYGEIRFDNKLLAEYDNVTPDDISVAAQHLLTKVPTLAALERDRTIWHVHDALAARLGV